jgi:hypothetical protein
LQRHKQIILGERCLPKHGLTLHKLVLKHLVKIWPVNLKKSVFRLSNRRSSWSSLKLLSQAIIIPKLKGKICGKVLRVLFSIGLKLKELSIIKLSKRLGLFPKKVVCSPLAKWSTNLTLRRIKEYPFKNHRPPKKDRILDPKEPAN